jgi:predicted DNA-binding transcriptional regulator YafY
MLWLVPDLPEEPDEPRRVAEVLRRHAGSLPEPQRDLLARAIVAGGPVRIDYRDSGGGFSTRVVEPLELDQVLLTAWCQLRDAERMFSLDRIESVYPA